MRLWHQFTWSLFSTLPGKQVTWDTVELWASIWIVVAEIRYQFTYIVLLLKCLLHIYIYSYISLYILVHVVAFLFTLRLADTVRRVDNLWWIVWQTKLSSQIYIFDIYVPDTGCNGHYLTFYGEAGWGIKHKIYLYFELVWIHTSQFEQVFCTVVPPAWYQFTYCIIFQMLAIYPRAHTCFLVHFKFR